MKFELTIHADKKVRYAELVTNHDAVASIEIVAKQEGLVNDGERITAIKRIA
jgi:hypothetical protein